MKAIIQKKYKLEKIPGKGGWTYAAIPEINQNANNPFGWVKVKGSIDNYAIRNYKLMPMGNGKLFLPIKASIRKMIGKEAGDSVLITLYPDNDPITIPQDFLECLKDEPSAHTYFFQLREGEQKQYIDWINEAKKEATRTERMAKAITKIAAGLTLKTNT